MPNKLGPVFSPKYHEERTGKRRRRGRRWEERDTKTNTGHYFRLHPIPILVTLSESRPHLGLRDSLDAKGDEGHANHQQVQDIEVVSAERALVQESPVSGHLQGGENMSE